MYLLVITSCFTNFNKQLSCCSLDYFSTILEIFEHTSLRNLYVIHLVNPVKDNFQL